MTRQHKRCRLCWCLLIVLLLGIFVIDPFIKDDHARYFQSDIKSACALPKHNPSDPTLRNYFWDPGPLICREFPRVLSLDSQGCVHFNPAYGTTSTYCHAYAVMEEGDHDVKFHPPEIFHVGMPYCVKNSITRIKCFNDRNLEFYDDLFYTVLPQLFSKEHFELESKHHPSVLVFGLDSVSLLMSKRKIPLTTNYLMENLNAIEFQGYTKIGENSFPNLLAMLTGNESKKEKYYSDKHVDSIHEFIWTNFAKNGYVTFYSEDEPSMPNFASVSKGFLNPPVHHYARPFFVTIYRKMLSLFQTITKANHCFRGKPYHARQIDMLKQFFESYKGKRKFAVSWHMGLSHNEPNYLTFGDADFRDFLHWMQHHGHLDNTVLFFISDHGSNINAIRNTPVGRIEEKMPMLYLGLPPHMRNKGKLLDHVEWNSRRLTTHFDTFESLRQIAIGMIIEGDGYVSQTKFGKSFFSEKIDPHRSCLDAHINGLYCPCYRQKKVNKNDLVSVVMAEIVIHHIRNILRDRSHVCEVLDLNSIIDIRELTLQFTPTSQRKMSLWPPWSKRTEKKRREKLFFKKYVILLKTLPGGALFEATLEHIADKTFRVIDPVLRANAYGNQSYCVKEKYLKPFCYCKRL